MKSGIKSKDIEIGSGKQAQSDSHVLIECYFYLNKGEEIELFGNYHNNQYVVSLNSRNYIPGLRHGIVGMREGGVRNLRISPHLAFGERGIENRIPPNAILVCKIKLLKIVNEHFSLPDPFSRKRQVIVSHRGEAINQKPRWTLGIINDGEYELTVNHPIPEMTWRYTKNKSIKGEFSKHEMDKMFLELLNFPSSNSNDIVVYENVWADMSEKAGNTPRERDTDLLCLHISLYQENKLIDSYYVTEVNENFQKLDVMRIINELLDKAKVE